MFKKKQKNHPNYLEMHPYPLYEHEMRDGGLVNVLVPKFTNSFMKNYFMPMLKSKYIRANLDEFGSAAWILLDGQSNVGDIAEELLNRFGESIQPAYERVAAFMTQLYKAGFIEFNEIKPKAANK